MLIDDYRTENDVYKQQQTVELFEGDVEVNAETVSYLLLALLSVIVVALASYVVCVPESKLSVSVLAHLQDVVAWALGNAQQAGTTPARRHLVVEKEEDNDTWEQVESRRQKRDKSKKKN